MTRFATGQIALKDLDYELVAAVRKDILATLSAAYTSEAYIRVPNGRNRTANLMTLVGRVYFKFHYAGKGQGAREIFKDLMGEAQTPKITHNARMLVAKSAVLFDSFAQAYSFLDTEMGINISIPEMRKITIKAGQETAKSWEENLPKLAANIALAEIDKRNQEVKEAYEIMAKIRILQEGQRKPNFHPKGSHYVGLTMSISSDGIGASCTKIDTQGIKGKDGGEAHTRETKVLTVSIYDRVDKNGRPIINPNCIIYFASTDSADLFASKVYKIIKNMGYWKFTRIEFVSDGAKWLEKMWNDYFKNAKVLRVIDFYHATQYLHIVVMALSGENQGPSLYKHYRDMLKCKGGEKTLNALVKDFGNEKISKLSGESLRAYNYLKTRIEAMDYGKYREMGYYIGSGTVESGCKTIVAARCKLAGMHWRIATVGAVAFLRATLRSNLPITV